LVHQAFGMLDKADAKLGGRALEVIPDVLKAAIGMGNVVGAILDVKAAAGDTDTTDTTTTHKPAIILLELLTPQEIHQITGFQDILQLLSFVAVVCGGDLDQMTLHHSNATWLEEWLYYFEKAYGRTRVRSEDLAKDYGIALKSSSKIFLCKLLHCYATIRP
jgi:hypothetical protein